MKKGDISKNFEAYLAIKELVAGHKLFPGQKLIYRDLEKALGMSKTPIINGLMRLEQEGLVVSKKNRGFFMREVSAEEAEQIYDLREKLEEISIGYAIRNYDDKDLQELEGKLQQYNDYAAPIYDRKRLELDTAFHMQIARMGKNTFFIEMIRQFYENIYFTLNVVYLTSYVDNFKKEHSLIFSAIKNRNLQKAKKILRSHTRAARKLLVAALQS
ncbi:MAG: GntR family transcriptional regulator [Deltaproteobacteria bacterium]|nr:GntR family transcriptional regulator [Deltaproteobacteria bacterium]MBW2071875.1 GntR family transcriptional regulator [Deltaproteobacteria bacterium]